MGLAVEAAGTILVTDTFAGTNMQGGLFRVDAATGARTLLSDFGNAAQGPTGNQAYDVAIEAAGTILVLDYFAATDGKGALFRVDPDTGDRTLLSDFGDDAQGPGGTKDPVGVAVEAAGTILIADYGAGTNFLGGLWRVDPVTGTRTLLSDFGNSAQGPTGENPVSVTVETTGAILVIDLDGGTSGRGRCSGSTRGAERARCSATSATPSKAPPGMTRTASPSTRLARSWSVTSMPGRADWEGCSGWTPPPASARCSATSVRSDKAPWAWRSFGWRRSPAARWSILPTAGRPGRSKHAAPSARRRAVYRRRHDRALPGWRDLVGADHRQAHPATASHPGRSTGWVTAQARFGLRASAARRWRTWQRRRRARSSPAASRSMRRTAGRRGPSGAPRRSSGPPAG